MDIKPPPGKRAIDAHECEPGELYINVEELPDWIAANLSPGADVERAILVYGSTAAEERDFNNHGAGLKYAESLLRAAISSAIEAARPKVVESVDVAIDRFSEAVSAFHTDHPRYEIANEKLIEQQKLALLAVIATDKQAAVDEAKVAVQFGAVNQVVVQQTQRAEAAERERDLLQAACDKTEDERQTEVHARHAAEQRIRHCLEHGFPRNEYRPLTNVDGWWCPPAGNQRLYRTPTEAIDAAMGERNG